jgi:hypothetical protein
MRDIFNTPAAKEWSRQLDAGMKDAERAPDVKCPVCGGNMMRVVGPGKLWGYRCGNTFMEGGGICVGLQVSVEDLCDRERWEIIKAEALERHQRYLDMRKRNGVLPRDHERDEEFEKIAKDFRKRHGLTRRAPALPPL